MSVQALSWVLESSEATGSARLVAIAIANHVGARGENGYPSLSTIAREARVSRRTAIDMIGQLEELGEVLVYDRAGGRGNGGKTNRYELPLMHGWTPPADTGEPRDRGQGGPGDRGQGGADLALPASADLAPLPDQGGEICDTKVARSVHEGGAAVCTRTKSNQNLEPTPSLKSADHSGLSVCQPAASWTDSQIEEWIHTLGVAASRCNEASQARLDQAGIGRARRVEETMRAEPRHRRGLLDALRPYASSQINHAVGVLVHQLADPLPKIRDPFAILTVAARTGDPGYFPPLDQAEALEETARAQLATMSADELEELDLSIVERYTDTPLFEQWFPALRDNYRIAELVLRSAA